MNNKEIDTSTIYFSYKHEAQNSAKSIANIFRTYSGDRLNIVLPDVDSPPINYHNWITERLKSSDLLLLLFFMPYMSPDWNLFEVGFFSGYHDDRPIICFVPPEMELPEFIKHYHVVTADLTRMRQFITDFFTTDHITKKKTNQ